MSRFLLLYSDAGGGDAGPLDPATLSPSEHYDETSWTGLLTALDWHDTVGSTRIFDFDTGTGISETKNGNQYYSGITALGSNTTPKSMSTWVGTDTGITFYVVARWDGADLDTLFYFSGAQLNELFRMKSSGGTGLYIQIQATNGEDLILNPSFTLGTWNVFAVRVANVTGAGVLDVFDRQETPTNVTNASWAAISMNGAQVGNKILNNNVNSENWDGAIAEMILFRDAHDDTTIGRVNAFLQAKWDIT